MALERRFPLILPPKGRKTLVKAGAKIAFFSETAKFSVEKVL
jgi:hypothetical protein